MYILPHHKIRGSLEIGADSRHHLLRGLAVIGCSGALEAMMHHAMPRGCRPAEPYKHNLDPTYTPTSTNAYISTLQELFTGIFRSNILSNPVRVMRLLHYDNDSEFSLIQFFDKIPRYAILSHTWGLEEVTFKDITEGNGASKTGFNKIRFCGEQARCDRLQYF